MPRLIRPSGHEAERWRQGSEFGAGDESKINLQSALEEKYPVNPGAGLHVNMMQGEMPVVHARSPIGEDIRQLGGVDNAKSEINVRPPVFPSGRSRTSDCSTTDATVTRGVFKTVGAQVIAFFRRKRRLFPEPGNVFMLLHKPSTDSYRGTTRDRR
jgi:hypothetical protein